MNRISISDFNGGMVNASDPTTIPDNAMVLVENYEYLDGSGLKIRKDANSSILNSALLGDINNIAIWYPPTMPSGSSGEYVVIYQLGEVIGLAYLVEGTYRKAAMFSDAQPNARIFVGSSRVLVADAVNPGRYIQIDKDGLIESGNLGIDAPLSPIVVSGSGDDNRYADVISLDTGMTVERGNILQYCYTVEDKYGSESNPSPITTQDKVTFRYPDATSPTGFKQYWFSTVISGMSKQQYQPNVQERLKYFNIYRRDVEYREGVIGKSFQLIRRVPIDASTFIDSSSEELSPISYLNGISQPSSDILEAGRVVYLGGVFPSDVSFPHRFDRYVEMRIANNNEIDYVNPVIKIVLNSVTLGISDWDNVLGENRGKIRIYMNDAITPVPVNVISRNGTTLTVYIKPPFLNMSTVTTLYIAIADGKEHGVPSQYNTHILGKFYQDGLDNVSSQAVLDINRPLSVSHKICTNVPYVSLASSSGNYLYNLANMLAQGNIKSKTGSVSTWTGIPTSGSPTSYGSYALTSDGRHAEYELVSTPTMPVLAVLDIVHIPRGFLSSGAGTVYDTIFECGNLKLIHIYLSSYRQSAIYLVTHGTVNLTNPDRTKLLYTYTNVSEHFPRRLQLSIYITKTSVRVYDRNNQNPSGGIGYVAPIGGAIASGFPEAALEKTVYLFKPQNTGATFSNIGNNVVTRFDLIEMPTLSYDEMVSAMLNIPNNVTFARNMLNTAVTLESKDFKKGSTPSNVMWSDLNGTVFSELDFKKMQEPVLRIVQAPSFLKQQYQNTVVVFTRNTITRLVLNSDMTASNSDQVGEYVAGGLYAIDSLVFGGNTLYWLSEDGVISWSPEGIGNISKEVISIPVHTNYVGAWIHKNNQYLLHDKGSGISYVYHVFNGKWTTFTGISFVKTANLNLGSEASSKILLLQSNGQISEYPGNEPTSANKRIVTKEYYTGNKKALRFRCYWDRNAASPSIKVSAYNHFLSANMIEKTYESPARYEWIYLPNGLWGETLQFSIDNSIALSKIDIDIRED